MSFPVRPDQNRISTMTSTYDSDLDFIAANSLFAALESQCLEAGGAQTLPYLGMARSELTDYGHNQPSALEATLFKTFEAGLHQLEELLGRLIETSTSLSGTLRLTRSREILREGISQA